MMLSNASYYRTERVAPDAKGYFNMGVDSLSVPCIGENPSYWT
jgi:hypothetical protein